MKDRQTKYGYYIVFLCFSVLMLIGSMIGLSAMREVGGYHVSISDTDAYEITPDTTEAQPSPDLLVPEQSTLPELTTTDTTVTDAPATEPPVTEPPVTEPPVTQPPATEPVFVRNQEQIYGKLDGYALDSTDAVSNSYFDDALFIGDSRTHSIQIYGNIPNAKYYVHTGLNVITAAMSPFVVENDVSMNIEDALTQHQEYKKIYISFGTNEFWFQESAFRQKYGALIDKIKAAASPDAKIYLCAAIPVWDGLQNSKEGLNNEKLIKLNRIAIDLAKERGISFIDLSEVFVKGDGYRYLDENDSYDGIHLYRDGVLKICDYLRTHT